MSWILHNTNILCSISINSCLLILNEGLRVDLSGFGAYRTESLTPKHIHSALMVNGCLGECYANWHWIGWTRNNWTHTGGMVTLQPVHWLMFSNRFPEHCLTRQRSGPKLLPLFGQMLLCWAGWDVQIEQCWNYHNVYTLQ